MIRFLLFAFLTALLAMTGPQESIACATTEQLPVERAEECVAVSFSKVYSVRSAHRVPAVYASDTAVASPTEIQVGYSASECSGRERSIRFRVLRN